jgi:hypothetical protein
MKPKLVHEVLRQTSPRKLYGSTLVPPNRYNVLSRDSSPADSVRSSLSQRSRSVSIKRKNSNTESGSDGTSYADIMKGTDTSPPAITQEDIDCVTENIVKVKSLCDKVGTEISNANIDPNLVAIFSTLNEAMIGICDNQLKIAKLNKVGNSGPAATPVMSDQVAKRFKPATGNKQSSQVPVISNMVDLATLRQHSQDNSEDPKVRRFKEAVKEAEKSTLVFNLNLGKVPIVNQNTICTNATKALTEMAAAVEKSNTKVPSTETMSVLDDVLSVVKGMKFFGRSTKSYQRPNDPNSGSFCTIPVKYEFNNKEERAFAETVLRDKYKVNCTVPYPTILRETIKQVMNGVKVHYPDYFVKVTVDTGRMVLRVAMRPKLPPGSSGEKCWYTLDEPVPIPPECLDLSARKVPENFKVTHEYSKKSRTSRIPDEQIPSLDSQMTDITSPTRRDSPSRNSPGSNGTKQRQV